MMGGLCINATLLYSEINILCGVIMLIIAINLSISGFDKSEGNRIFLIRYILQHLQIYAIFFGIYA